MGPRSPSHGGDVVGDGVLVEVGGSVVPLGGSLGGGVIDDEVLVEVGGTVVLLGGVVDSPVKRMTYIGGRGVSGRRIVMCLLSFVDTPLPLSIPDLSW